VDQTLHHLIEALPDAVLLVDNNRQLVAANEAARGAFGAEIVGRDLALAVRHPDVLAAVEQVTVGGTFADGEISHGGAMTTTYKFSVRDFPAGPDQAFTIVVLRDVSAAKAGEQMRADFVANVSHELRSPLASLVGFIETLKGPARDDTEARGRFLDIMQEEAGRMSRLVDDLLSLSRVEANEHVQPSDAVDVSAILQAVSSALATRAGERGIRIDLVLDDDLKPAPGDEDQLVEVFNNLVDNAVKYGPRDSTVSVQAVAVGRIPDIGGPGISVSVRNAGEGIAAAHLPRLTERFYRADKSRSREMGGTGLGLAIVKHIVNRHRGRLTIESRPGEGATFTVYLPTDR